MEKFADLHMHTYFSDGTNSPEEVVKEALAAGLSCIAITDHDTVDGIQPTLDAAKGTGLEVLAGIELSTEINGRDVHMLGYLFDYTNEDFKKELNTIQNSRIERMAGMIQKLDELGIHGINLQEVCALAHSKAVGRPHLATVLYEKGKVSSIKEAFDKYLAEGAPAYVSKFKMTPVDAIKKIKSLGGVSVLAHPMVTRLDELIPSFAQAGLNGIEAYYPNNPENIIDYYLGIAKKNGLLVTGGSDSHGAAKTSTYIGRVKVPYTVVEQLKAARGGSI